MQTCPFCGKERLEHTHCDCWESVLDREKEMKTDAPDEPEATPERPRPAPTKKQPHTRNTKNILSEIRDVISETLLPYHRNSGQQTPMILSFTSSFFLLGIHLLLLFFFFSSLHTSFQNLLGADMPPSGSVVLLPVICIIIHIFAHWGFMSLFTDSNKVQISIEQISSIISANTVPWSISLFIISLILRIVPLSNSVSAFFILLIVGFSYLTTCLLFIRRLEPYQPLRNQRHLTAVMTISVQTGLLFVAMLSLIIRMIDQFLGTLFR